MRFNYPVMLDVTHRLVVIVGGGAVARRKVKTLLEAGATRVRVVAPKFHAEMPNEIERIVGEYDAKHLHGATLVHACTDQSSVNDQVVRDARACGALVNRLDQGDEPGDFVTPALWREGGLVLAVSSGSPALSAAVRDDLASSIDDRHVRMSSMMEALRPKIRDSGLPGEKRAEIFRDLAEDQALDALMRDSEAGLIKWLAERHPELKL